MPSATRPPTLLAALNSHLNVDADTLDSAFIASLPVKPHDVTSNPGFLQEQIANPANLPLMESIVAELGKDASWVDVYTRAASEFGALVFPHITGRVLSQVLPSQSLDKEAIKTQARNYVKEYNARGIPTERTCIKIPMTGAGAAAAAELTSEGISCLGTCLFNLPQAIAASQAGLHAISVYFNRPYAGEDIQFWPDVADPATMHPMASRHVRIRQVYDRLRRETGLKQPQMKTAGFLSVTEALSMVELGADNITLGKETLADLCLGPDAPKYRAGLWKVNVTEQVDQPDFEWERWEARPAQEASKRMAAVARADSLTKNDVDDWLVASTTIDYLAPGVLDKYNEEDEATLVPLALQCFGVFEQESKEYIERLQARL